jgi:hypothetical protein
VWIPVGSRSRSFSFQSAIDYPSCWNKNVTNTWSPSTTKSVPNYRASFEYFPSSQGC